MRSPQLSKAIEACRQCAAAASQCATVALLARDARGTGRLVQLALDCAAACRLLASAAGRDAAATPSLELACAALCDELAAECGRYASLACRRCAVACRYTARACREAHAECTDAPGGMPAVV